MFSGKEKTCSYYYSQDRMLKKVPHGSPSSFRVRRKDVGIKVNSRKVLGAVLRNSGVPVAWQLHRMAAPRHWYLYVVIDFVLFSSLSKIQRSSKCQSSSKYFDVFCHSRDSRRSMLSYLEEPMCIVPTLLRKSAGGMISFIY